MSDIRLEDAYDGYKRALNVLQAQEKVDDWRQGYEEALARYNKPATTKPEFELYTSYFANIRSINKDEYVVISIANSQPKGFDCLKMSELVPSWFLVQSYKSGTMTEEEYEGRYNMELSKVSKDYIISRLNYLCRIYKRKKVLWLCWEAKDKFCHRHIARRWIGFGKEL